MELLERAVVVEDENLGNAPRSLHRRKYGILAGGGRCVLVHPSFTRQKPVHADLRIVERHGFEEIKAGFVTAGQDMGNPGTGDAEVYAVAAVSLLSLIAAQYVYKKSKRA